jgi:hypothetical protein
MGGVYATPGAEAGVVAECCGGRMHSLTEGVSEVIAQSSRRRLRMRKLLDSGVYGQDR